jgi:hypothetical protein
MKTLKIFSLFAAVLISSAAFSQEKNETFKVSGECGMCKSKIEKAAKAAGASFASWNVDKKELTVKYNSVSTNTAKIQQEIAKVGYDTPNFKATDDAYNNLHECCKYDRSMFAAKACCEDGKCTKDCCKDGKCEMECCKDGKCTKGGECCKSEMECCKDGKCSKEAHNGKDCCKKS